MNEWPPWMQIGAWVGIAAWVIGLVVTITRKHTVYNRPPSGGGGGSTGGDGDHEQPEKPRAD